MSEQIRLDAGAVVTLQILTSAGTLLSSYARGAAANRVGSKPVLLAALVMFTLLPLGWWLLPRQAPTTTWFAYALSFTFGVASAAWAIAQGRLLWVKIIPPARKTGYTAVYYAWLGALMGLGPILTGAGLDLMREQSARMRFDLYAPVWLISIALVLIGLAAFRFAENDREHTPHTIMKIESIDPFYLSMPQVLDIGDGSQNALVVRVRSNDGFEGFGECEASPLTTIAAMVCPLSHSDCKPVQASVLGQTLNEPADVLRIGEIAYRMDPEVSVGVMGHWNSALNQFDYQAGVLVSDARSVPAGHGALGSSGRQVRRLRRHARHRLRGFRERPDAHVRAGLSAGRRPVHRALRPGIHTAGSAAAELDSGAAPRAVGKTRRLRGEC
jgi:hypothetical protein